MKEKASNIFRYTSRDARRRNAEKSVRLAELQPLVDAATAVFKDKIAELEAELDKKSEALKEAEEVVARQTAEIDALKAAGESPKATPSTTHQEASEGATPKKTTSKGK